jgi:hypothetical protein
MAEVESTPLLPVVSSPDKAPRPRKWLYLAIGLIISAVSGVIIITTVIVFRKTPGESPYDSSRFFHQIKESGYYCEGSGKGLTGYVGLKADEGEIKRSFFV